jgi:hypothetical protein
LANSLISGFSREIYGLLGKITFTNVVFPDWRGPVSTTTGKPAASRCIVGAISLGIIEAPYANVFLVI